MEKAGSPEAKRYLAEMLALENMLNHYQVGVGRVLMAVIQSCVPAIELHLFLACMHSGVQ